MRIGLIGITERYNKPSDLPARLPVFPLNGVIMLPRVTLPLNIFEPRYLSMLDDALAGGRLIGIVQPRGSDENEESPRDNTVELRRIGTVGRIGAFSETNDGRYIVSLTGVSRFAILSEVTTASAYRICEVDYEPFSSDLIAGHGEEEVDRDYLIRVLRQYLDSNELDADWDAIGESSNEYLVNTLATISPYGLEEKQALLEAADLKTRAEVLVALAEMEMASNDDGSGSVMQ